MSMLHSLSTVCSTFFLTIRMKFPFIWVPTSCTFMKNYASEVTPEVFFITICSQHEVWNNNMQLVLVSYQILETGSDYFFIERKKYCHNLYAGWLSFCHLTHRNWTIRSDDVTSIISLFRTNPVSLNTSHIIIRPLEVSFLNITLFRPPFFFFKASCEVLFNFHKSDGMTVTGCF